ncbi:MAG: hypothetical protein L3J56_11630 [Bacteroidales bacterium]|nr:hypothetical protein [Bacteroidales bacterium]
MKDKFLKISYTTFDKISKSFESPKGFNIISSGLAGIFVFSLLVVFIKRNFNLPDNITSVLPGTYFFAVEITFTILLAVEIIEMVFILAHSVTDSVAKQFEILSLILLRQAFKEFSNIDMPVDISGILQPAGFIMSDIFGALLIFGGILLFKKMQKHRLITANDKDTYKFTALKKALALFMLAAFIVIGIYDVILYINGAQQFQFFTMFYNLLIFTDILIVIISLRYSHLYCVVFRNTGFAIATILIRFALSIPNYYDAAMGIISVIFVISITYIYNKYEFKRIKEVLWKQKNS